MTIPNENAGGKQRIATCNTDDIQPERQHCYTNFYMNCRGHRTVFRWTYPSWGVVLVAFSAILASAQELKNSAITPLALVRMTVNNEVNDGRSAAKFMFRSQKQTPKGSQTRLYVETSQAMAGMLVAINDQPLSAEQRQAELNHLFWLEGDPDAMRKKRAREKEDAERTNRIMKALPDAFVYEDAGTEKGTAQVGGEGRTLTRLKFTPNPGYAPPTHVEQVLTGMQGYVLIDAEAHRIARIDGKLFKAVSFGWGIVGHLDRGSTFCVQQANVGDGAWEITEMKLNITGKILIFKSLAMISDEVFSEFQQVPDDLTFAKGVELLKTQEQKFARGASVEGAGALP